MNTMDVFFVYDTTYCKAEGDDPKDAILYKYPVEPSDSQNYTLHCQLVGLSKFLKSTFSEPSVIALEQQKFAFAWFGKYLLVLGGHLSIKSGVLKNHLSFLCGIFCFYHGSIDTLLKECRNNKKEFLSRMEIAWSRYISLSRCFDNLLGICVNPLPLMSHRKNSSLIAKASHLLHMCQLSSCVLAGVVYSNSRVLASQLTSELTSFLTLMSNSNAAAPVSNVLHSLKTLPPDVELKYVYLSKKVIQSILKYNHNSVGSPVRVMMNSGNNTEKISPVLHNSVSSGSEADVDSGNCSESLQEKRKYERHLSKETSSTQKSYLRSIPHSKSQISCCITHMNYFKRCCYKSRNQNTRKLLLCCDTSSEKSLIRNKWCTFHSSVEENMKKFVCKGDTNLSAPHSNLICSHHADFAAEAFVSDAKSNHFNLMSACDFEFTCSLCVNYHHTMCINIHSFKKWNSDLSISVLQDSVIPEKSFRIKCVSKNTNGKKRKSSKSASQYKIQILKCRARSGRHSHSKNKHCLSYHHSRQHLSSDSLLFDFKEMSVKVKSKVFNFPSSIQLREIENVEKNDLEKSILYVQRCDINTLVLLLKKNFDESNLTYLWNCGFSVLANLDYDMERKIVEVPDDVSYYALVYNNTQGILKEHPHNIATVFTQKNAKEAVQVTQEDFQSNPDLHMIFLLGCNESVFACQTKQYSAFYLQPELNSRKVESLYNLSRKAMRRLDKFFKFKV